MKNFVWSVNKNRVVMVLGLMVLVLMAYLAGRLSVDQITNRQSAANDEVVSTWTVKPMTIDQSLDFRATVKRSSSDGPLSGRTGVITASMGTEVSQIGEGDKLFEVNGTSTIAGVGSVPAYRDLNLGARGADVRQLVEFLCRNEGLKECYPPEKYDDKLESAVRKWQKQNGMEVTGVISRGDIMWFESLPTPMSMKSNTSVGSTISDGDRPITVSNDRSQLVLSMAPEQAKLIPPGAAVRLSGEVEGRLEPNVVDENNESNTENENSQPNDTTNFSVVDESTQQSICDSTDVCRVPLLEGGDKGILASVIIVPKQSGLGVPTSAIKTAADGKPYVVSSQGQTVEVKIKTTARGMSLVEGLKAGFVAQVG